MPGFARATALPMRPFDHDIGMIRNDPRGRSYVDDRKALFMGKHVYGFAGVGSLVKGLVSASESRYSPLPFCESRGGGLTVSGLRSSMDYVSLNSGRGLSLISTIKWSTRRPSKAKGSSKRAYEYAVLFSMCVISW